MRLAVDGGFALAMSAERPFLAASGGALYEGVRLGGRLSREVVVGWCLRSREALQQSLEGVSLHFGEILQIRNCQAVPVGRFPHEVVHRLVYVVA
jgi:hypothetical protein